MSKPTPQPRTALPRIMPVPPADPPYDDEREPADDGTPRGGTPMTYGSLALAEVSPSTAAQGAPGASPGTRRRPGARAARWAREIQRAGETEGPGQTLQTGQAGRTRGIRGARPGERHLRCLGQAMAEVLTGRRPAQTVQDKLSERAYRELVRAGKMIHTERPPTVGRPHVQWPRDGVAEMCLLVNCGTRNRVLALRLERLGVQWLITEFETA